MLSICGSCNFLNEEPSIKDNNNIKDGYDLYVPSEMSLHMNDMYDVNEEIKNIILSGELPKEFPEEILKIHKAKLSDFKERSETFEAYSSLFIEKEKLIFDTISEIPLEQRYNDAINSCISCHKSQCPGPIPRISKLLIN
jgi:hypothetical protein